MKGKLAVTNPLVSLPDLTEKSDTLNLILIQIAWSELRLSDLPGPTVL